VSGRSHLQSSPLATIEVAPAQVKEARAGKILRMKECPQCGEVMRLVVQQARERIPGRDQMPVRLVREWVCPECDHFEEAEAGDE
jgi:uncharacterized protein with PIN domain